jgi:hypothetical protein
VEDGLFRADGGRQEEGACTSGGSDGLGAHGNSSFLLGARNKRGKRLFHGEPVDNKKEDG